MQEIANYNFEGMCIEKMCDKRYTHSVDIALNNIEMILCFCRKHAELYDKNRTFAEEIK